MTTVKMISFALLAALFAGGYTLHGQENKAALDAARSNVTAHITLAAELLKNRPPRTEEAIAEYEAVVAMPEAPNKAKIAALKSMADACILGMAGLELHKMDIGKAHAILRRALELPGLKPDEMSEAWQNIAKLHERQDNYAEAAAAYAKMLEVDPSDKNRAFMARREAGKLAAEGNMDKAIAIYRTNNFPLVDLFQNAGDTNRLREFCLQTLKDPAAEGNAKWTAFTRLPSWNAWRSRDFAPLRADCESWLPALMADDTNRSLSLMQAFKEAQKTDQAFVAWAAPLLLQASKLAGADYTLVRVAQLNALAALGKTKELTQAAEAMAKDEKLTVPARFQGALTAAALKAGGGEMKKFVADSAKAFKPEDLPVKEKSEAVLAAARTAMAVGQEKTARGLFAVYEGFFVQLPRATTSCAFMAKAPIDVGSWMASPILKDPKLAAKLDRPYGDNLKFLLETDAAVTGRNIGPEAGTEASGDNVTDFYTVCDTEGLHFFFMAYDTKVEEVVSGYVTGGSYEGYLAPGSNQPYSYIGISLPDGDFSDQFPTMYRNRHFRPASRESGLARAETRAVDKGFATHLFYDWESFYDKLPANGDAWQFENIRWTRAGGLSFGGSQSVHNRSSWGDIVFSGLTPEALNAIKRRLVLKAVAQYRREGQARVNGVLDYWRDAELGDPEFYRAELKPLVEPLDEFAKKAGKDMTPELVESLFAQAVPGWMEIEYLAAERRRIYLDNKRMTGQ